MALVKTELLTQERATDLLDAHSASLRGCVDRAWNRWLVNPDAATASKRARAATVYDYVTQEVELAFANTAGVKLTWKHGSLSMTVEDTAVIKFKKFRTRSLRTSGIATTARNSFLRQSEVLDGMVVTHLIVGYLLDSLELQPETIAIVCPLGKSNLWTLALAAESETDTIPGTTPIAAIDPAASTTVIRSTTTIKTGVNESATGTEE